MRILFGIRLPVLAALLVSVLQPVPSVLALPDTQATTSSLIAEVNVLRTSNGLPAYTVSTILMGTAQGQADYMAATGSITHTGPNGITLTQRLLNAGYPLAGDLSLGGFRAENITGGPNKTAAQAVQEWTGDAAHLNTMLSPNLQEIGAGVARVGEMYYLVIDCALPTGSGQQQAYTPPAGESVPGAFAPSDFIVPVVTSTPDSDGFVYHEVQYGQTLWSLAIAYGVKIDGIRSLNNLGPEEIIYQGERLLVRKDAPPSNTPVPSDTSEPVSPATPLEFPTAMATQTPAKQAILTATSSPEPGELHDQGNNYTSGIVVGIILMTLILVGLFSHFAAQKLV
jgi:uncharacterized protein YkwD/LysM repeat protein